MSDELTIGSTYNYAGMVWTVKDFDNDIAIVETDEPTPGFPVTLQVPVEDLLNASFYAADRSSD